MVVSKGDSTVLVVAEHGLGKRTPINEYRLQKRGGFGVIKEERVNILCRDIEEASEINLEEAESLAATAKENMTKSDSKKGYIENQLKFDRETARVAAAKMWKESAGGAPVFGS